MKEPTSSGGWKVKIDRRMFDEALHFYVLRHVPGFTEVVQPGGIVKRLAEGEPTNDVQPSFTLGGFEGKEMMIALAEALEEEGVKTPNDFKIQGLLEATRAHLADLRQMLKLK